MKRPPYGNKVALLSGVPKQVKVQRFDTKTGETIGDESAMLIVTDLSLRFIWWEASIGAYRTEDGKYLTLFDENGD